MFKERTVNYEPFTVIATPHSQRENPEKYPFVSVCQRTLVYVVALRRVINFLSPTVVGVIEFYSLRSSEKSFKSFKSFNFFLSDFSDLFDICPPGHFIFLRPNGYAKLRFSESRAKLA